MYVFRKSDGSKKSSAEMIGLWKDWLAQYPEIFSLEDGLAEEDWNGWADLTKELGSKVQLVGDDIFVTNPEIFEKGIQKGIANSILIKLNQIGTITETLRCIKMAHDNGYTAVVSHRSGETDDTTIADFAVATGSGQIKTGSASRGKELPSTTGCSKLSTNLGQSAIYAGHSAYSRWRGEAKAV